MDDATTSMLGRALADERARKQRAPMIERNMRFPEDLLDWLGETAQREGVSVNGLVMSLLGVARSEARR